MIAALLLAASPPRARRPKALLPFPELPLVTQQWLALRAAGCDPLRIVVGAGEVDVVVGGSGLARENFVESRPGRDPLSPMRAGLRALLRDRTWPAAVVQPVARLPPHPSIVVALAATLVGDGLLAAVPSYRGRGGHPVLLARELCEELLAPFDGAASLGAVLRRLEPSGACRRVEVYTPDVLASASHRPSPRRRSRASAPPRRAARPSRRR